MIIKAKAKKKGINLLPREYILEEKFRILRMIGGVAMGIELLIFILIFTIPPKQEIRRLDHKLDELSIALGDERFKEVNKTLADLEATKTELDAWMLQYKDLKSRDFISTRVLDTITSRLPEGVHINSMEMIPLVKSEGSATPEVIKLTGSGSDLTEIATYATLLESIYGDGAVVFQSDYDKTILANTFEITLTLPIPADVQQEIDEEQAKQAAAAENASVEEGSGE